MADIMQAAAAKQLQGHAFSLCPTVEIIFNSTWSVVLLLGSLDLSGEFVHEFAQVVNRVFES